MNNKRKKKEAVVLSIGMVSPFIPIRRELFKKYFARMFLRNDFLRVSSFM
jgi:hypothetical protein